MFCKLWVWSVYREQYVSQQSKNSTYLWGESAFASSIRVFTKNTNHKTFCKHKVVFYCLKEKWSIFIKYEESYSSLCGPTKLEMLDFSGNAHILLRNLRIKGFQWIFTIIRAIKHSKVHATFRKQTFSVLKRVWSAQVLFLWENLLYRAILGSEPIRCATAYFPTLTDLWETTLVQVVEGCWNLESGLTRSEYMKSFIEKHLNHEH